jgi:hypothetical protein
MSERMGSGYPIVSVTWRLMASKGHQIPQILPPGNQYLPYRHTPPGPRVCARRIAAGDPSRRRRVGQGPAAPRMRPSLRAGTS